MKLFKQSLFALVAAGMVFSGVMQSADEGIRKEFYKTAARKNLNSMLYSASTCRTELYYIVKILILMGADPYYRDDDFGESMIYLAVKWDHPNIIRLFIEKGFDINVQIDDGWTLLSWAANYGRVDIAHFLIDGGANINVQDVDGKTPIYLAARQKNAEIVRYLLSIGANPTLTNNKCELLSEMETTEEIRDLLKNAERKWEEGHKTKPPSAPASR